MARAVIIVIVALACGFGGFELGRQTAPRDWENDRKKMYHIMTQAAKRVRGLREIARPAQKAYLRLLEQEKAAATQEAKPAKKSEPSK